MLRYFKIIVITSGKIRNRAASLAPVLSFCASEYNLKDAAFYINLLASSSISSERWVIVRRGKVNVVLTTAWPHWMSGQMLSSHSIVTSSRTVRSRSPWRGRWIGHWRTTWLTVCSPAPHSKAAEEAISHFYKQERKRPTAVRRWLSRTQALLGRVIPGGWMPVSEMKMRSLMSCPPTPHGWNCFLKNRKTFVACETYSQWSGVSEEIFGCPLNIKHSDFSVHFCFFWPNHLYKKVSKHEVATTCHMKLCTYDTPPTDPARDAPWSFIENLTNHVYSPSGPRLFEAIYL